MMPKAMARASRRRMVAGTLTLALASTTVALGVGVPAANAADLSDSYVPSGYERVFVDEFSGTQLNKDVWNLRQTSRSNSSNVSVSNGQLHVDQKKVGAGQTVLDYRGGGVSSKQHFGYGYYEARMFFPAGLPGWHPAFWTQIWDGAQAAPSYDAEFTEIDIAEHQPTLANGVPTGGTFLDAGILTWRSDGSGSDKPLRDLPNLRWKPTAASIEPIGAWHTFGLKYTATDITIYLDGNPIQTQTISEVPNSPMSIWLTSIMTNANAVDHNRPVGASYGTFDVDWVAYYAPGGVVAETVPAIADLPAPVSRIDEDFVDGNASRWQQVVGTWSVGGNAGVQELRSTAAAGDAIATYGFAPNTFDYSPVFSNGRISATIRLDGAAGSGAGLLGRYTDQQNYYYLQLHPGRKEVILLKRTTALGVVELARAPFALQVGASYDVDFELYDLTLTAKVNGTTVVQASDPSLISGRFAVKGFNQPFAVSDVEIAALDNVAAEVPEADVTAVASSRCVAGKAVVTVAVKNDEVVPATVSITTAFGSKADVQVAPGKTSSHAFTTRAAAVASAAAGVTATAVVNGVTTSAQRSAPYPAVTC